MSHSTHAGFNGPPVRMGRLCPSFRWRMAKDPRSFQSRDVGVGNSERATAVLRFSPPALPELPGPPNPSAVVGVGHDEDAVTEVRGTNGGSRNARPLIPIPELGQLPEDLVSSGPSVDEQQAGDVLHQHPLRSQTANSPGEFRPEPPLVGLRLLTAGFADGLTGESSSEKLNWLHSTPVNLPDVSVTGDVGPVPFEDGNAEGVVLDLPAALPSCSLEPKAQTPDPGEQLPERRHI